MFGFCSRSLQLLVPRISVDSSVTHFQKAYPFSSSLSLRSEIHYTKPEDEKDRPFAVSYLINSFGFSPELALSLSNKRRICFNSPEKADLVVKLLKHYGCSDTLVSKIVREGPKLLVFNAQKTLLPKLEFFASIGISGTALAGVLSMNPPVLQLSLEKTLRPCYRITKTLRIPPEKLPCFFRDFRRIALGKLCIVASNTSILRAHGVPESSFPLWVPFHFNALSFDSEKVKENVKKVRSMGFQPLSAPFMKALYVISVTNASKWQQNMDLYRKWGLTEDDVLSAFRKYPLFMNFSEKVISSKMDFFVNSMGCQPSFVAACPDVLCYSLEKRIIPRCSVIRLLQVEGLIAKEDVSIQNILKCNEESFFKRYVINYQEQIPELLSISQGKKVC